MCIFRTFKDNKIVFQAVPTTKVRNGQETERALRRGLRLKNVLRSVKMFPPLSAGPSGAYSPDATMGYMMDGQAASMMHRPPGDPTFHNQYHYPPEYYGHHL
ncbi:hypothetical protein HZH66_012089 [Vespula vulgaris]|uniref:Uncharacterized protein n=2 Tax=Vespula TaxID=7451 RepID=A0A834JAH5_VESVU|nr:hypothetical protein HZH66_012089 [Vespula vulgaris]